MNTTITNQQQEELYPRYSENDITGTKAVAFMCEMIRVDKIINAGATV